MSTLQRIFTLLLAGLVLAGAIARAEELPTELDSDRVPATKTGGNCLIRNATILTASQGRIESGDVLVRDGKIVAVGRGVEAPEGFAVIDATGKFLIPGIIDCHSHMAISGGVNEGTLSITAECRIGDVVRNDDLTIYRALAGGVTAANLLHGSANAIGGQNAIVKMKYRRPVEEMMFPGAPRGIKFALEKNPKRSNFRSEEPRFPSTRMGVEAVIRRGFLDAKRYMKAWEDYAAARSRGIDVPEPRRDLRLETLAGVLRGEILVHSHCYRADEILMLLRVAEDFGFRIATLQHVLEGFKVAPEIAAHGATASTFADWWAYKMEAYDAIPYNAALMTKAGVVVSLNSDSGELVRRLYHDAAKAMKYGDLSEEEALRLVTLNPAIQLRIDERVGSIDVGKDADLALFSGHPLSVYSHCDMTLVDGEVFFERVNRQPTSPPRAIDSVRKEAPPKEIAPLPADLEGPVIAIRNATLHPVSADPVENGTIVVRGGLIAAVGPDVAIPEGALAIDGTGLHVYPGMIDSGTSIGLTEIGSVAGTQDTREIGGVNPDLRSWIALNPDSEYVPVTRVNGITTAVTGPSGGSICGQAALIHLDGWTYENMLLEAPLALVVNFPRVPGDKKWQDDDAVTKLGEWFDRAVAYGERTRSAETLGEAPPPFDAKLDALLPYATGNGRVILNVRSEKQIVDAVEFALAKGIRPVLRGCLEAWKVAGWLASHDIPCIVGPVLTQPARRHDPYDAAFFNASVLHEAGVRFAFQSSSGSNARNLPHHAGMAAAFGLDPEAAYRAVTLSAAEILGVEDRIGSLEVGKIADLLVTDGDPLEFRTKIRHVFIAGRQIPLESKHTRLYERYLQRVE